MGIIDGVLGGVIDFLGNENLQDQAQGFNAHEAALQRDFNSAQAMAQRDWQERMSNTAVKRHARDLQRSGFNPLLAIHPGGGATTPSGATATSGMATSPGASSHTNFAANMQSASQIAMNEAAADKLHAEADEVRARTPRHEWDIEEIKARIPVHQAQVQQTHQNIRESIQRMEKMWTEMQHLTSGAAHLDQQVKNLQATLPLIKEQVRNFRALTAKNSAETEEIKQRIKQNLPEMTRILGNLERIRMQMAQPGQANAENAADSYLGQLGAYLREINPLRGLLNATPR